MDMNLKLLYDLKYSIVTIRIYTTNVTSEVRTLQVFFDKRTNIAT